MNVFLSFSHRDLPLATRLRDRLVELAHIVDSSPYIPAGAQWDRHISDAIDNSDCLIALISEHSETSDWCRKEQDQAIQRFNERRRPIIVPLCLDGTSPTRLNAFQRRVVGQHDLGEIMIDVHRQAPYCRNFWGDAIFARSVRLVVATRKLIQGTWDTHAQKPKDQRATPEGVNYWLAAQDMRAAVHLTNSLSRLTGHGIDVVHDETINLNQEEHCVISLGLGFNQVTIDLPKLLSGSLFDIVYKKERRDHRSEKTDWFTVGGLTRPKLDKGFDEALIARIVLPAPGNRRIVHFVCAGRTALGTAVAGCFLAEKWTEIVEVYNQNKELDLDTHSIAVVVRHVVSKDELRENDRTGELVKTNDKVEFASAVAVGFPARPKST